MLLLLIEINENYKTKDSTIYASIHCCILDNNCREENRNLSHTSFIRWTTTIRHARASLHACKQNHHDKLFLKLVGPMLQKENNSRFKLISSYIYIYSTLQKMISFKLLNWFWIANKISSFHMPFEFIFTAASSIGTRFNISQIFISSWRYHNVYIYFLLRFLWILYCLEYMLFSCFGCDNINVFIEFKSSICLAIFIE